MPAPSNQLPVVAAVQFFLDGAGAVNIIGGFGIVEVRDLGGGGPYEIEVDPDICGDRPAQGEQGYSADAIIYGDVSLVGPRPSIEGAPSNTWTVTPTTPTPPSATIEFTLRRLVNPGA